MYVLFQSLIAEREGYDVEEQVILYSGKPLEENVQLVSLSDFSTLEVDIRMLGGK